MREPDHVKLAARLLELLEKPAFIVAGIICVSDVNNDERVSIADITTLIDQRVNGGAKVIKGNAGLTLGTSGDNWR